MKTVSYPGGMAELRDSAELTVRQRRIIENAAMAASEVISRLPKNMDKMPEEKQLEVLKELALTETEKILLDRLQDAAIFAMLKSLSNLPTPSTPDEIQDLPGPIYDALSKETATAGAEIAKTNYAPDPDPSAPTGPSGTSGLGLRGVATGSSQN